MRSSLTPAGITRYQWLTVATAALTLALIAVGAVVRTTESGLGCPDWPLCHGGLIPPADRTAIIEYSHRSLAAVVGLLVVATSLVTLRLRRHDVPARGLAAAALPLLALQAWLGKVTVERELPAEVVTFHLATALILLAVLALLALFAFLGEARTYSEAPARRQFARVAAGAALVTAGVLLGGSYVVGADATAACSTWPGCVEAPLPFLDGGRLEAIHWLHRLSVLAGLAAVALVALAAYHLPDPAGGVRLGAWTLLGLYVAQIAIGALNIWSQFASAALVAHLAVGAAIWANLVLLVVGSSFRPAALSVPERAPRTAEAPAGSRA